MKQICLILLGLAVIGTVTAQTPTATPTAFTGALLNRLPNFSSWKITVTHENASEKTSAPAKPKANPSKTVKAPAAAERMVSITKTGDVLLVESTDKKGVKVQEWHKGEYQVVIRPEWQTPLVSRAGNPADMAYTDYAAGDFPNLRWLSRKNYAGIDREDGHDCLVFSDKLFINPDGKEVTISQLSKPIDTAATGSDDSPQAVPVTAYIDYYSRLPVSASRGEEVSSYLFKKPPTAMQVLPAEIQSLVDAQQAQSKAELRAPAKP